MRSGGKWLDISCFIFGTESWETYNKMDHQETIPARSTVLFIWQSARVEAISIRLDAMVYGI